MPCKKSTDECSVKLLKYNRDKHLIGSDLESGTAETGDMRFASHCTIMECTAVHFGEFLSVCAWHLSDLSLVYCLAADGAHTLTCALMLLNTDLHGHVSTGGLYLLSSTGLALLWSTCNQQSFVSRDMSQFASFLSVHVWFFPPPSVSPLLSSHRPTFWPASVSLLSPSSLIWFKQEHCGLANITSSVS